MRRPKNLNFLPPVIQKAEEIRAKTGDPSFSALCVRLVIEEHDRRVEQFAWVIEIVAEVTGHDPDELRRIISERLGRKAPGGAEKLPTLVEPKQPHP